MTFVRPIHSEWGPIPFFGSGPNALRWRLEISDGPIREIWVQLRPQYNAKTPKQWATHAWLGHPSKYEAATGDGDTVDEALCELRRAIDSRGRAA